MHYVFMTDDFYYCLAQFIGLMIFHEGAIQELVGVRVRNRFYQLIGQTGYRQ